MLGDVLAQVRRDTKLTQEQVALKAGISREYVSKIENNVYHPTVEVFVRLCRALGTQGWIVLRRFEEG